MKRLLLILVALVSIAQATTKLRLHDSPASVAGYKAMDLSLGPPQLTQVFADTATTAAGNDIQVTRTNGGTALQWISEPLSSTTTISGTISFNVYARESAAANNATLRALVVLYHSGAETTTISDCGFGTELGTSVAARAWTTASGGWTACSVTSTAITATDRIVLRLYVNGCTTTCTVAGGGMGAASGATCATAGVCIDYDGHTDAADGSSWIQLNETETFSANGGAGGTPVPHWNSTPDVGNAGQLLGANDVATVFLPPAAPSGVCCSVPAGDFIGVFFYYQAGTVWSVTDNQSDVYTLGPTCNDGSNVYSTAFYYLQNAPANVTNVQIKHTTGTAQFFAAIAFYAENIATASALDASACAVSSAGSTTPNSGAMTSLTNGDLIVHTFFTETNLTVASIAPAGGFSLLGADRFNGHGGEWEVQASAGAITPTITIGTNQSWVSAAVALKSSTAGSAPTGIYVNAMQSTTYGAGQTTGYVMQFPTVCSLHVDMFEAGLADRVTGITSSPNTWTVGGYQQADNGPSGTSEILKAANATPSSAMTLTIATVGTSASDDGHVLLDICGASTTQAMSNMVYAKGNKTGVTPIDASAGLSGGTTCNGNTVTCSMSITPAASTSLVLASMEQEFNTVNATSTSGCVLVNGYLSTNTTGNTPFYENQGWMACLDHATSAIAISWTDQSGLAADSAYWSNIAAEFTAPSASGKCAACDLSELLVPFRP